MPNAPPRPAVPLGTCIVTDAAFQALRALSIPPAHAFNAHAHLKPSTAMTPVQHTQRLTALRAGREVVTRLRYGARPLISGDVLVAVVTDQARSMTTLMLTNELTTE